MIEVDLNSDLGESFGAWTMGDDAAMLDVVTSANVACGFHAGDPDTMLKTVENAKARGVAIGAHPGFHDLQGFGRRQIQGLSERFGGGPPAASRAEDPAPPTATPATEAHA